MVFRVHAVSPVNQRPCPRTRVLGSPLSERAVSPPHQGQLPAEPGASPPWASETASGCNAEFHSFCRFSVREPFMRTQSAEPRWSPQSHTFSMLISLSLLSLSATKFCHLPTAPACSGHTTLPRQPPVFLHLRLDFFLRPPLPPSHSHRRGDPCLPSSASSVLPIGPAHIPVHEQLCQLRCSVSGRVGGTGAGPVGQRVQATGVQSGVPAFTAPHMQTPRATAGLRAPVVPSALCRCPEYHLLYLVFLCLSEV